MTSPNPRSLYIIGDIHGQYARLVELLRSVALISDNLAWAGGAARLWLMGDFFDRGPAGIEAVDLVMRLQSEAAAVGGSVQALFGNHELLILGAQRFGDQSTGWGTFRWDWQRNGGNDAELERLTPAHITWLLALPAMALVNDNLLVHADSTMYSSYGESIEAVNVAIGALLHSDDSAAWDHLLGQFGNRKAFVDTDADGASRAIQFLRDFGGRRIIHGHTPIGYIRNCPPKEVVAPLVYAGGLCVNVDGGMYRGGPGFVYQPESQE